MAGLEHCPVPGPRFAPHGQDTYSRMALAKLYTEKTAITAADMLNDRLIPFFLEENIPLLGILTDRGTEYWGKLKNHAYQLYLAIEDIDHTRTKANSPQTNSICERFHRTIQDECYSLLFQKKLYRALEELQTDVDEWIRKYNEEGPHSGRYCCGKTPWQTFLDSKHIALEKDLSKISGTAEAESTALVNA